VVHHGRNPIEPKNTECLLDTNDVVALEVNPEKTKYMLITCYQKARPKHSVKIVKRSCQDVSEFKYLGQTLTDRNCMHEEINSRLDSVMLATVRFGVFCPPGFCLGT
jgi:hypothetical protein